MKQYISCFVVVLWCAALSAAVEAPMDPPADQGRFSALLGPAVLAWTSPAMDAVSIVSVCMQSLSVSEIYLCVLLSLFRLTSSTPMWHCLNLK